MTAVANRLAVPLPQESPLTLSALGPPSVAFAVWGLPKTQGSKSALGKRTITTKDGQRKKITRLVESSDVKNGELTAWRKAVAGAALATLPYGFVTLDGPLVADMVVTLPRNSRTPKTLRTLPATKPDLDKLLRAVWDALGTTAPSIDYKKRQIIAEDSRIVAYRKVGKVWAADPFDTDALRRPGAVIRLWRYPETLLGKNIMVVP